MRSKKPIWGFRVAIKTYRNFRVPRELIRSEFATKANIRITKHANKKRARRLNYIEVLGFE